MNVFIDGESFLVLPPTRPHKRRHEGDRGPMVAGMGSISPIRVNATFHAELGHQVVRPLIDGLRSQGAAFRGCMFLNLMLTESEIVVLECNCRMGDPAMLVNLALLESPLSALLHATTSGGLGDHHERIRNAYAVAVTIVHPAYPATGATAFTLPIDRKGFWNGLSASGYVVAGGACDGTGTHLRLTDGVFATAVARGATVADARAEAYALARLFPTLATRADVATQLIPTNRYSMSDAET